MVKQIITGIASIVLLGSCSTLKPLNFINSNTAVVSPSNAEAKVKFLDNLDAQPDAVKTQKSSEKEIAVKDEKKSEDILVLRNSANAVSSLQLKYATLLNTDPSQLQNQLLFENIDEWYGTRYRLGGTTKSGIDCSAFVAVVYAGVFGVALPRTARDQYGTSKHISRTQLKEGDLLFFNTRGGVSHVGIYLQNNKFVHASAAKGVTISDMFEPYYLQHFIGAGRVKSKTDPIASR
jgi:cell wall-associated NlpC family hydrolase